MFGVELPVLWFVLVAVLFAGYFLLEGFDFGVGMLLPILGRDERKRKAMISTIGPVWDGNEVWLITAGGALFAAFPEWYATMFSGFYLPLFFILLALIVRVIGLEWRSKVQEERWRSLCDAGIIFGSWLPPVLWGIAMSNLVRGVRIDENKQMSTGFSDLLALLTPYALLGGLAFSALFVFHAVAFLRLKTSGSLREHIGTALPVSAGLTVLFCGGFAVWTQVAYGKDWTWIATGIALACVVASVTAALGNRDGWAFFTSSLAVLSTTVLLFGSLYPFLMPSTVEGGVSLDIWNSASNPYTLRIMTWSALVVTPLVIGYQSWTYWVFRKRISADPQALADSSAGY